MNSKIEKILIAFTLSSLTFIHTINLINGNIFELELGFLEKLSLIFAFFILSIFLCLLIGFVSTFKSKNIKGFIFSSICTFFFIVFFNNQTFAIFELPIGKYFHGYQIIAFFCAILFSILFVLHMFIQKKGP